MGREGPPRGEATFRSSPLIRLTVSAVEGGSKKGLERIKFRQSPPEDPARSRESRSEDKQTGGENQWC